MPKVNFSLQAQTEPTEPIRVVGVQVLQLPNESEAYFRKVSSSVTQLCGRDFPTLYDLKKKAEGDHSETLSLQPISMTPLSVKLVNAMSAATWGRIPRIPTGTQEVIQLELQEKTGVYFPEE